MGAAVLGAAVGGLVGVLLAAWWKGPLIRALRADVRRSRRAVDAAQAEITERQEKARRIAERTRRREDELVAMARVASSVTAEVNVLRASRFNLHKELEGKQAEVISLEARVARLHSDLGQARARVGQLERALEPSAGVLIDVEIEDTASPAQVNAPEEVVVERRLEVIPRRR